MSKIDAVKYGSFLVLIFALLLSVHGGRGLVTPSWAQHAGHGGAPAPQAPAAGPEDEQEAPVVEIPLDKQQMIGVKTVAAAVRPLQKTIRTVGRVEYDERKLVTINIKFEGWIEKLHVDYAGKQVSKGEPLAEIYSPELFATQQEFLSILKWSRPAAGGGPKEGLTNPQDAGALLEATRQRLRLWDISDEQIAELERTGKAARTMTIHSPADGVVVQKAALQGMRIMPGDKLFDIADLSSVWVIADIYEYELPHIRLGDTAKITLDAYAGKELSARIDYIYPELAGGTRTAKVRFSVPNPGGRLKPQMFTNVELKTAMGNRLAVPEDAVIDTGVRQVVYVDQGDGYFEYRRVTLGLRADGMVEVLKGLQAGESVATAAVFLIDSEAKLKGIVQ